MKWPWRTKVEEVPFVSQAHDNRTRIVLERVEAVTRRLELIAEKLEQRLARMANGTY